MGIVFVLAVAGFVLAWLRAAERKRKAREEARRALSVARIEEENMARAVLRRNRDKLFTERRAQAHLRSSYARNAGPRRTEPADTVNDLLNPLNILSPMHILSIGEPSPPACDPSPSHDHGSSYDAGCHSSYDSGASGSYDSGSSDSGGSSGGGD